MARRPLTPADSRPDTMLSGTIVVKKRLFFAQDTHYAIVEAVNPEKDANKVFTFKGTLENCTVGATYFVKGYMQNDPTRGTSYFKIKHSEFRENTSTEGWVEYLLREGPNVGDMRATELVTLFGDKVIHVLANEPDKALVIQGLTQDRLRELSEWAKEEFIFSDTKKMLYALGLTPGLVRKLVMKFGRSTAKVVKSDPFKTMEVDGISFITASKIGEKVGCDLNNPTRIRYGLLFTMEEHASDGHTCILGDHLIEKAQKLLAISRDLIIKAIQELIKEGELCTPNSNPARFAKNPSIFLT